MRIAVCLNSSDYSMTGTLGQGGHGRVWSLAKWRLLRNETLRMLNL